MTEVPAIKDDLELLRLMMRDVRRQEGTHRPGPFWQGYASRVERAVWRHGLAGFRSREEIGKGFSDVLITDPIRILDPSWRRRLFELLRRLPVVRSLVYRYVWLVRRNTRQLQHFKNLYLELALGEWLQRFAGYRALPETRIGDPASTIHTPVGEIGEQYLRMFAWIEDYSRLVDFAKVRSVLEIGGGFGAMAHSLLHMFPGIRVLVYVDVPPMLYVGTQYLKSLYGSEVEDYRACGDSPRIPLQQAAGRRIIAIAPWQLSRLEGLVDFVWNSSSFQEMPADTLRFYGGEIARLLSEQGLLGAYVYRGGKKGTTLAAEELVGLLEESSGLRIKRFDAPVAAKLVPGDALLGRR